MEIFQYLKNYLPALLDVNYMHLLHSKNGNVLNSMFFLPARLIGTVS